MNTAKEEWRTIPGFPGYEVSNQGRVKTSATGLVRKPNRNHLGYAFVGLRLEGRTITRSVHALVMLAFVGPRPFKAHINHRDHQPGHNGLDNLEYCTAGENLQHGKDIRDGRIAAGSSALTGKARPFCDHCSAEVWSWYHLHDDGALECRQCVEKREAA